jgi:hypothetical protein
LLLGAAGITVAALGWVIFVPADPYYTPSIYGFTNRVNGLAGVGLVMIVYAACGIVGGLIALLVRRAQVATVATLGLALAVGVAYLSVVNRHGEVWTSAFRAEMAGIAQMKSQLPRLADGTTLFVSGHPAYQTLGVPIFSTTWDVDGMVKMQYKNPTLSALPVTTGTELSCSPDGVRLVGPGYESALVPFANARFLDIPSGRTAAPQSLRACRRAAPRFVAGPDYLSYDY